MFARESLSGRHRIQPNLLEANMNLIRSYKNWRRYSETVRELNRLNTRELNDLGINRADIAKVARAAL